MLNRFVNFVSMAPLIFFYFWLIGGSYTIETLERFNVFTRPEQFDASLIYYYSRLGMDIAIRNYILALSIFSVVFYVLFMPISTNFAKFVKLLSIWVIFPLSVLVAIKMGKMSGSEYFRKAIAEDEAAPVKITFVNREARLAVGIPRNELGCLRNIFSDKKYIHVYAAFDFYREAVRTDLSLKSYSVSLDKVSSIITPTRRKVCSTE